jgi:putative aminopeptidase FrvX
MPNTQRDIPDLLAQYPDGGAPKNITPQKHRDLIVSLAFVKPYRKTANYELVLTDAGAAIEMNLAGANTLTVPPDASVAFDIGTVIEVMQYGAGQTTVTPGAGVTIRTSSSLTTRAQYSVVSLRKTATDEWVAAGDLT